MIVRAFSQPESRKNTKKSVYPSSDRCNDGNNQLYPRTILRGKIHPLKAKSQAAFEAFVRASFEVNLKLGPLVHSETILDECVRSCRLCARCSWSAAWPWINHHPHRQINDRLRRKETTFTAVRRWTARNEHNQIRAVGKISLKSRKFYFAAALCAYLFQLRWKSRMHIS